MRHPGSMIYIMYNCTNKKFQMFFSLLTVGKRYICPFVLIKSTGGSLPIYMIYKYIVLYISISMSDPNIFS